MDAIAQAEDVRPKVVDDPHGLEIIDSGIALYEKKLVEIDRVLASRGASCPD